MNGVDIKRCADCGELKPTTEFAKNRGYVTCRCKACYATYVKSLPGNTLEARRRSKFRSRYGITLEQYEEMFKSQNGVCAVCSNEESNVDERTGEKFRLSVDHDHRSGRIRGLLCQKCNRAIGLFGDDIGVLSAAIDYLKRE